MHARELVELAAVVSAHGPALACGRQRLPSKAVEDYWSNSKCRLDRWNRSLRRFNGQTGHEGPQRRKALWPLIRAVLEEVLTGEILVRVWAALGRLHDDFHACDDANPIAQSVLVGHLDTRHRVLTLLVRGPGVDAEAALKLNRLRRHCERWTDLLVGHLHQYGDVAEAAVVPGRAVDFSRQWRQIRHRAGGVSAAAMMTAAIRTAFSRGLAPASPNADLNAKIGSAVLRCIPDDAFDATGLLQPLWIERLYHAADDAQGLIEDLLAAPPALDESSDGGPGRLPAPLTGRLRRRR